MQFTTNLLVCLASYLMNPILTNYSTSTAQSSSASKILLVIGADISSSFPYQEQLDTNLLRQVCLFLENTGYSSTIALETIGDPVYRSFLRCEIEANPPTDRTLPPTRRKETEKTWLNKHNQNLARIHVFIDSCYHRLHCLPQKNTDLNGFFNRASRLCQEPQFYGYEKIVYINSDGDHDVTSKINGKILRDRKLNSFLPTGVCLWVSCWTSTSPANLQFNFESPNGFWDYLRQHIKKQVIYGK